MWIMVVCLSMGSWTLLQTILMAYIYIYIYIYILFLYFVVAIRL